MKQQDKIGKVMREFKSGDLKSSSGSKVTNPKQAMAIALSEAGVSKKGKDMKADGVAKKGKTKGEMVKMAKGGACDTKKMAKGGSCGTKKYARGGGCEIRGKTKGKMVSM